MVTLAQYRQQYGGGGMGGEVAKGVSDILQALLMYQLTQQKQEREDEQTRYDRSTEQKAFAYGQAQATIEHTRSEIARIRTEHEQSVRGAFAAHGTRVDQDDYDARRDVVVPFRSETGDDNEVTFSLFDPAALGEALYEANAELFQRIEALQEVIRDPLLNQTFQDAGMNPDMLAGVVDREADPLIESAKGVYSMLMHSSEQGAKAAGAFRDRQVAGVAMPTSDFQKQQSILMGRYMPEMAETTDDFQGLGALLPISPSNEAKAADLKRIAASTGSPEDDAMVDKILKSQSDEKSDLKGRHIVSDSAMYAEQGMDEIDSDLNYFSRYRQAVEEFMAGNMKPTKYELISRSFDESGRVNQVDTFTGELGSRKARLFDRNARKQGNETRLVATLNDGDYMYAVEMEAFPAMYRDEQDENFATQAQYAARKQWEKFVAPANTVPLNDDRANQAAYKTFGGDMLRPPKTASRWLPSSSRRPPRVVDASNEKRTELQVPAGDILSDPRLNAEGILMPGDEAVLPTEGMPSAFAGFPVEAPGLPPIDIGGAFAGQPPVDTGDAFAGLPPEFGMLLGPALNPGPPAAAYPDMPPAFPLQEGILGYKPPTNALNDQPAISPQMQAQNELDRLRFLTSEEAATMFAAGEERERQRQGAMENFLLLQDLSNDINQEQERQRLGAMQNYELLKGWLGDRNEYETSVRDADMPSAYPLQEGILRDRGAENLDLLQDIIRLGKKQTKQKASDPDRRGSEAVSSLLELSREAAELEEYNKFLQRMYGSRNK